MTVLGRGNVSGVGARLSTFLRLYFFLQRLPIAVSEKIG